MSQTTTTTSSNSAPSDWGGATTRRDRAKRGCFHEFFVSARISSSQRSRHCRRRSVSEAATRTKTLKSSCTATEMGEDSTSGLDRRGGAFKPNSFRPSAQPKGSYCFFSVLLPLLLTAILQLKKITKLQGLLLPGGGGGSSSLAATAALLPRRRRRLLRLLLLGYDGGFLLSGGGGGSSPSAATAPRLRRRRPPRARDLRGRARQETVIV